MEQIELVIRIDRKMYEAIMQKEVTIGFASSFSDVMIDTIHKGTLLPEGHGRLIDADKFDARMYQKAFIDDTDMQKWDSGCWIRYKMYEIVRDSMPTIIEADKEGAEE